MTFTEFIAATFVAHPIIMVILFPELTLLYSIATSDLWFGIISVGMSLFQHWASDNHRDIRKDIKNLEYRLTYYISHSTSKPR